ncbi:MAG TPA: NnrS family protein [Gammaproteobacteria bacterium]|nr:NnrS family protein [Gammaproteobacteria bacterium]
MTTPVLRLGFRPFFLSAGVFAVVAMMLWVFLWRDGRLGAWSPTAVDPIAWHAHEMVFGYALAVVAGFLLTAVRNWTARPTPTGGALAALVACWALARVCLLAGPGALPIAAFFDLAFNLGLLVGVARPIVAVGQKRQAGIVSKIALLGIANALFYVGAAGWLAISPLMVAQAAVFLLVALVLTLAGRVLPGFIERGVRVPVRIHDPLWPARASLVLFFAFFVVEIFLDLPRIAAALAAALAVVTAWRLIAWHTRALWREPLLWGLYAALLAIWAGFVLYALADWLALPRTLALHAFAAGGIGLATLAMMARVSLGHTGRDIRRPPAVVGPALGVLAAGVIARVALPLVWPDGYAQAVLAAQTLWALAFALFVVAYAPILLAPRVDGADG